MLKPQLRSRPNLGDTGTMTRRAGMPGAGGDLKLVPKTQTRALWALALISLSVAAGAVWFVIQQRTSITDLQTTTQQQQAQIAELPAKNAELAAIRGELNATTSALTGTRAEVNKAWKKNSELAAKLAAQPKPTHSVKVRASEAVFDRLRISSTDDPLVWKLEAVIERAATSAINPKPDNSGTAFAKLEWMNAAPINAQLRFVVFTANETDGPRLYWPAKSWRKSNGEEVTLTAWQKSVIGGELRFPEDFKPATVRAELYYETATGDLVNLRRAMAWPAPQTD